METKTEIELPLLAEKQTSTNAKNYDLLSSIVGNFTIKYIQNVSILKFYTFIDAFQIVRRVNIIKDQFKQNDIPRPFLYDMNIHRNAIDLDKTWNEKE